MASLKICKHCKKAYRRSKNRVEGRSFCSIKCFYGGQKISVYSIWKRDRGQCHLCGFYCPLEQASRDHLIPRFLHGKTTWNNLKLAHRMCNSMRGHRDIKAYQEWWENKLDEIDNKTKKNPGSLM